MTLLHHWPVKVTEQLRDLVRACTGGRGGLAKDARIVLQTRLVPLKSSLKQVGVPAGESVKPFGNVAQLVGNRDRNLLSARHSAIVPQVALYRGRQRRSYSSSNADYDHRMETPMSRKTIVSPAQPGSCTVSGELGSCALGPHPRAAAWTLLGEALSEDRLALVFARPLASKLQPPQERALLYSVEDVGVDQTSKLGSPAVRLTPQLRQHLRERIARRQRHQVYENRSFSRRV